MGDFRFTVETENENGIGISRPLHCNLIYPGSKQCDSFRFRKFWFRGFQLVFTVEWGCNVKCLRHILYKYAALMVPFGSKRTNALAIGEVGISRIYSAPL